MLENELYEPMRGWLEQYLNDKYKGYDIIADVYKRQACGSIAGGNAAERIITKIKCQP